MRSSEVSLSTSKLGACDAETFGAHFDLPRRFFAGDVEAGESFLAHRGERLKQQCRFADAGVAADQDHRAGHQAAAEHAIELADTGKHPAFFARIDLMNRRRVFFVPEAQFAARRRRFLEALFGEGVPLIAVGTFAEPFGRLKAAALASEDGFSFGHGSYRRRSFELEKRPTNSHHFNQLDSSWQARWTISVQLNFFTQFALGLGVLRREC